MAGRKTSGEDIPAPEIPQAEQPEAEAVAPSEGQPVIAAEPDEVALKEPEEAEAPSAAEVEEAEAEADWDEAGASDIEVEDDYETPESEDEAEPEEIETETEAEPAAPEASAPAEPQPAPVTPAAAPTVVRRGPGFVPLVLGGIVAAGIGFGGAQYLGPQGWPFGKTVAETEALKAELAKQAGEIAALQAGLTKAQSAAEAAGQAAAAQASGSADLSGQFDTLKQTVSAGIEANKTALAELGGRVDGLEKRPTADGGVSGSAMGAYERDVQALREALDGERQRTDALSAKVDAMAADVAQRIEAADAAAGAAKAQAAAQARAATARGALARVLAALDAGGGFAQPLADLNAAGVTVPAALSGVAEAGVPTLAALQQGFPEAARAALAAAIPETMGDSVTGRITAFLQAQTGARSLTPRDGGGPDAVLSRAEAALRAGKPAEAVDVLKALPEAGQKAMAGWVAQAQTRIDALEAAQTVAAGLNGK